MRCALINSGETAHASSSTVSSPAGACSCGRNPTVADFSREILPSSGDASPRIRANSVDFPAPLGPTRPTRSPRFTWSDASSKRTRPAKALVTWEIVSMRAAANLANPRARASRASARHPQSLVRRSLGEGGSILTLLPLIVPGLRETGGGHRRNRQAGRGVVRGIVEKRQPRAHRVPEIDDVQRRRILIEGVAVTPRIESDERAEEKPDRRLVRHDKDIVRRVLAHNIHQNRQCPRRYGESALAADRRKRVRIFFPRRRFLRKSFLHFLARHLFPPPVRNLTQAVACLHFQAVRLSEDLRRLHGPSQRRSVDRGDLFAAQAIRQPPHLLPPFIGKLDICRASETIFRRQHSGSMTNKKNSCVHNFAKHCASRRESLSWIIRRGGLKQAKPPSSNLSGFRNPRSAIAMSPARIELAFKV